MALLPLKDDNPLKRIAYQYVTLALIVANVAVFFWQLSLTGSPGADLYGLGTIPAVLFGARQLPPELVAVPAPVTLVTSLFLHGGWMHLIMNMLFLWIFGDNVEDAMGHMRFFAFYMVCGIAGGLAQSLADPGSTVPIVGASSAISGVLGAYLVLHPKARVLVLLFFFPLRLPAVVVLGTWIGVQILNAWGGTGIEAGGVARWAHIGGFMIGALLILPMRRQGVPLFDRGGPAAAKTAKTGGAGRRRSRVPDSGAKDG